MSEMTVLHRIRSRPAIELFRVVNAATDTCAVLLDELLVGVHERGAARVFYRGSASSVTSEHVCTFERDELVRVQHLGPQSKFTFLTIPGSELRQLTEEITGKAEALRFPRLVTSAASVRERLLTLAACIRSDEPELKQEEALVRFFGELLDCCAERTLPPPGRLESRAVRVAREYLHGIPDRDVRLAEVAAAARVTPYHLSHIFVSTVGVSVHAYHLLLRIRHARTLLAAGLNAGEAAAAVGFADQSHFTRHFKRIVGVPPGHYARGLKPLAKASPNGRRKRLQAQIQ